MFRQDRWPLRGVTRQVGVCLIFGIVLLTTGSPLMAADSNQTPVPGVILSWLLALAGAVTALIFAFRFFWWMVAQDEGDPLMVKIAGYVRQGANAYLWRQYRLVASILIVVSLLLALMAFGLEAQSRVVPFAFLTAGFLSALAGWFGMKTATYASSRTAEACKKSLNAGLQVAFRSGAVMGLTVVGLALLDITVWFAVLYWVFPLFGPEWTLSVEQLTMTMLCFGMGVSIQSLCARVGGGIFTKAADVGADLVGKVEAGIPEDDPRNPATIADNVGDNVGDVAGMGADLYESYYSSILATAALGVAAYPGHLGMQLMLLLLPMVLGGFGNILSIMGIFLIHTKEQADQKSLLRALGSGVNASGLGVAFVSAGLVWFMLVQPSQGIAETLAAEGLRSGMQLFGVYFAILSGLLAGVLIGWWTEYSTSDVYAPTKRIADQAVTGPATVIIAGIAEGLYSVWVPIVVISVTILVAFGACTGFQYADPATFALGLYGVAIAAVGMLSTLGITLTTDAYGPIADNAGGNAEMSKLHPSVRERTDALDSLGNTTAATGKGFSIGSAALTALALLAAYLESVRGGFNDWVKPIAVVETLDEAQAQALVVRSGVLAVRHAGENHNTAYLVYPPISASHAERIRDAVGRNAKVGETITLDLPELERSAVLVSARHASIPNFVRYYEVNIMNPKVLVGSFLGVMLVFVFCSLTMKAVGRAATMMVAEVRRQFREIAGIMEGTGKPDYAACVDISTAAAQREMVIPALLALVVPPAVGLLLGVSGVMGMLAGGLTSGFAVAIMMANAGGAWDNAKKYIESGAHGGKGTNAHKAAVVGDTVGDPFKDTSGPSLNILIKLMAMVSVVVAGIIVQYALHL
ncbi:MAG TPA: sodium-translocating pyrophosphatase [Planctomicrobium sp.]|nr:sodium-translocating pyrophosphatase [Planctomicrobium sp.]